MRQLSLTLLLLALVLGVKGQNNTSEYVYSIFQSRCVSCHSNSNAAGGLDLQGAGATTQAKMADVYQKIFNRPALNAHAAGKGYKIAFPGDPERSTLFRQVHAGLQPNLLLDPAEGDDHSDTLLHRIKDYEKESIRQWLLYGAPAAGKVADVPMLQKYYSGQGVPSFTTPPPAPAPGEGFQIHLGPFFLEEFGEAEYFIKYATLLPNDVEVHRIETLFGPYSHHFILFDYHPNLHTVKPAGLRHDNAHLYTRLISVNQFADTLDLPEGSAFSWEAGTYLDLNTHYINYSSDKIAACEVYLNIYTQPKGTAAQEMQVALLANTSIVIPNDGQEHTFSAVAAENGNPNNLYIWALTTHTHQWGTDFNVFTRNAFGQRDDMIFDAEYKDGDPNGFYIGYDYQHPPIRYYPKFLTVRADRGLIYEASYVNNGPATVRWGDTSDDEMMVLAFFYLEDTTGVSTGTGTAVDPRYENAEITLGPNPFSESTVLQVNQLPLARAWLSISDLSGRQLRVAEALPLLPGQVNSFRIDRGNLSPGVYLLQLHDEAGRSIFTGKLLMR